MGVLGSRVWGKMQLAELQVKTNQMMSIDLWDKGHMSKKSSSWQFEHGQSLCLPESSCRLINKSYSLSPASGLERKQNHAGEGYCGRSQAWAWLYGVPVLEQEHEWECECMWGEGADCSWTYKCYIFGQMWQGWTGKYKHCLAQDLTLCVLLLLRMLAVSVVLVGCWMRDRCWGMVRNSGETWNMCCAKAG